MKTVPRDHLCLVTTLNTWNSFYERLLPLVPSCLGFLLSPDICSMGHDQRPILSIGPISQGYESAA